MTEYGGDLKSERVDHQPCRRMNMVCLNCIMISSVHLAGYQVSRAKYLGICGSCYNLK